MFIRCTSEIRGTRLENLISVRKEDWFKTEK